MTIGWNNFTYGKTEICFPVIPQGKEKEESHLNSYPGCIRSVIFFLTGSSLLEIDALIHTIAKEPISGS